MPSDRIRVAALIEASSVTGPAKNLIGFARDNGQSVDIRVYTFVRGQTDPDAANPFIDSARKAGLTVEVIPERRRFDFEVVALLKRHFAQFRPQLVETHSVKSHFLLSLIGDARPGPWIAFHHGYTNEDVKMRLYNALDRYSLRHSDRMVTVCEAFVPELESCGVPRNRVDILHNSIDPAWNDSAWRDAASSGVPPPNVEALRASLRLSPTDVQILSIGRLSKEKGHSVLVQALARVREVRPELEFSLLLVGDGPLREKLVALVKALALENRVQFAGQATDVKAFFGVADLMALPSFSEGSPNVVLEAMASRVAIVASRVGGVPEMLCDRETALLVPPGNPEALAAALIELIDDRALRAQLAKRAQERVISEFNPARYSARLIAVYEKALKDRC